MGRKPTGQPRGRRIGSGKLGLGTQDQHQRLTLRIPQALYDRLTAYADGRTYTRGTPQLAGCVRAALEHFLECPHKRQTVNGTSAIEDDINQTVNSTREAEDDTRQTSNSTEYLETITRQTSNLTPETEDDTRQTENVPQALRPCGHPQTRWNANRRVCRDCDQANAQAKRAQAKRDQAQQAKPKTKKTQTKKPQAKRQAATIA